MAFGGKRLTPEEIARRYAAPKPTPEPDPERPTEPNVNVPQEFDPAKPEVLDWQSAVVKEGVYRIFKKYLPDDPTVTVRRALPLASSAELMGKTPEQQKQIWKRAVEEAAQLYEDFCIKQRNDFFSANLDSDLFLEIGHREYLRAHPSLGHTVAALPKEAEAIYAAFEAAQKNNPALYKELANLIEQATKEAEEQFTSQAAPDPKPVAPKAPDVKTEKAAGPQKRKQEPPTPKKPEVLSDEQFAKDLKTLHKTLEEWIKLANGNKEREEQIRLVVLQIYDKIS